MASSKIQKPIPLVVQLQTDVDGSALKENGSGFVIQIYNRSGDVIGNVALRPRGYQENLAMEVYSGDWASRAWAIKHV